MKPINLRSVEERSEGAFEPMPAGAYPCTITAVEDVQAGEYLRILVDVSAGQWAGEFSRPFYADKPWARSLMVSYKEGALGFFKGRMHVITDCNPGFDAEAAIFAGQEQMLVGRAVGVVFNAEEYLNKKTGAFEVGSNPRPQRLCRLSEVEGINAKPLEPVMMSRARKVEALKGIGLSQYEAEGVVDGTQAAPPQAPASSTAGADVYADLPF